MVGFQAAIGLRAPRPALSTGLKVMLSHLQPPDPGQHVEEPTEYSQFFFTQKTGSEWSESLIPKGTQPVSYVVQETDKSPEDLEDAKCQEGSCRVWTSTQQSPWGKKRL